MPRASGTRPQAFRSRSISPLVNTSGGYRLLLAFINALSKDNYTYYNKCNYMALMSEIERKT